MTRSLCAGSWAAAYVRSAFAFVVACVMSISSPAVAADKTCQLFNLARLPMTVLRSGRIGVPMTVGGKTVTMLVDTGAIISTLSPDAVASLGLSPRPLFSKAQMTEPGEFEQYVTARDVFLGRLSAGEWRFLVMPRRVTLSDEEGLLGPDILSSFDVEFDFANASLNLFQSNDCSGTPIYWTRDPHAEVDIALDYARHAWVPITVDGTGLKALLDTGSSRTVARLEAIEDEFGIDEKSLKLIDGATPGRPQYRYPFKVLSIEGVTVDDPDIVLIPNAQWKLYRAPEIILGMNILRQLHVYIAYERRRLYITSATAH